MSEKKQGSGRDVAKVILVISGVTIISLGVIYAIYSSTHTKAYLVLVNKTHPLPEYWENKVQLDTVTNSLGEENVIEHETYKQYVKLRDELLAQGVQIELDSVYRSIEDQQETWDWFVENYGEEYTKGHVSLPGYSEHHTGLAVDIFIMKDGKEIRENEEMVADTEDFAKVHALLPKYGFILRYLPGKKEITGYDPEPWHLRYIGDERAARYITEQGLTLEEYLGEN